MSNIFVKKLAAIGGIMLLLMIALSMTDGVISERSSYQNMAKADIANSWTGAQQMTGPILVMPYIERVKTTEQDDQKKRQWTKVEHFRRAQFIIPNHLTVSGTVKTELHYRGIYRVPVYTSLLQFNGDFDGNAIAERMQQTSNAVKWETPYIAVIINDIRGIGAKPMLVWKNQNFNFNAGSAITGAPQGMHAALPPLEGTEPFKFEFAVNLRGTENLNFAPIGNTTQVNLQSNWQHPSFSGKYLPERSEINAQGFSALWRVSSFSSNIELPLQTCLAGNCQNLFNEQFGVALIQPVDIYQLSERSVKYGLLFISLTFIAFLVFEITKKHAIHPVQYLLVGFALAIFYLLLISLSEHIDFAWAYLIAAFACTSLLGYYLTAVLRGWKPGLLFAAMLGLLYAALYVIIGSEDTALLMGSCMLFLMLAILMQVTRRIDWYSLGADTQSFVTGK